MSASSISPLTLEEAIRQSGEEWVLDWFGPRSEAIERIRQTLKQVNNRAKERLGENTTKISEMALVDEYHRNPQQVRGFFQALGSTRTPDMLLMAWRIIQGMEVKHVGITYDRQQLFKVEVILETPEEVSDPPYTSSNINDFTLLRHIGAFEIGGSPVLDGFYALKVRRAQV